jgi:GNAT superfamily N-acetyltransferase
MIVQVSNNCTDFNSYRAARVKSLFNAESGANFSTSAELPIDDGNWQIGLIVGPSGSGKTSIGRKIFSQDRLHDLNAGWEQDKPIVDCIAPDGDFNAVTGALANVGLGDVPTWLRPFHVLSNGQKFRAGLAKLMSEAPDEVVVDEFTSVVDRQIAKIGALAFAKGWRRLPGKKVVLLSCHYDIIEWLQPDWIYDTKEARFERDGLRRRPQFDLEITKASGSYWKYFKSHYYLDLPMPPAAEYFVGTVEGELVCHLAVCPMFTADAYRATRLVVMPEWQGAGVGTKFLEWICQYHLEGNGRSGKKFGTLFHTSHPQLCSYLRSSKKWIQKSANLYGGSKAKSAASIRRARTKKPGAVRNGLGIGFGGHFRAVQGFKYIGKS